MLPPALGELPFDFRERAALPVAGRLLLPLADGLAEERFWCAGAVSAASTDDTLIALVPANNSAIVIVLKVIMGLKNYSSRAPEMQRGISLIFSGKLLAVRLKIYF
ncbi:MAG: hypothetical protein ABSG16_12715 [Candidatus Acidiferrum sp.]